MQKSIKLVNSSEKVIEKILRFIHRHKNFLVSAHVRGDGDAIGSQIALNKMLKKMGKNSHIVCDHGVSKEYSFLPGANEIESSPNNLKKNYDAVFVVDSSSFERLERVKEGLPQNIFIINIDHHGSNEYFGNINWVDSNFSSTGEMIYELIKAVKVKIDKDIAVNLYVAIVTDTGRFSFSNTNIRSFLRAGELLSHGVKPNEIAKKLWRNKEINQLKLLANCINNIKMASNGQIAWVAMTQEIMIQSGFVPTETQEYIDIIKSLKNVKVAILFRELEEHGKVKVSFRVEKGVNGIKLAGKFGGGGHPRASGATLEGKIKDVEKKVVNEAIKLIRNG